MHNGLDNFDGTGVVYFGALDWCYPCKTLHPMMEEISSSFEDVDFFYVDADEYTELIPEHDVMSVPTVKFYVNNETQDVLVGLKSRSDYVSRIEKLF